MNMNEFGIKWSSEDEKRFWREMEICKGQRADGKDGRCIDPGRHNLGCANCPIGEAGLYEPEVFMDDD